MQNAKGEISPVEIIQWFEKAPLAEANVVLDFATLAVIKRKRPRRAKKDDKQKPLDM